MNTGTVQLAYYTRSKKKSARDKRTSDEGASPSSHGGHAPGGGEPSVVTRSRAPRSSMPGAGSNPGEDQDQAHQAVAIFFPVRFRAAQASPAPCTFCAVVMHARDSFLSAFPCHTLPQAVQYVPCLFYCCNTCLLCALPWPVWDAGGRQKRCGDARRG